MKKITFIVILVALLLGAFWVYQNWNVGLTEAKCKSKGGRVVSQFDNPVYKEFIGSMPNNQHADICVK